MVWSLNVEQLPDLLTAFADAETLVGPAFSNAVRPFGYFAPKPEIDQFRPDKAEWRIGWWLHLPDRLAPYETVRCELDLGEWDTWREVCGWVKVDRYVGHGATLDGDLWRSAEYRVDSPTAAAAAIRAVSTELVLQLGRLDLTPYFLGKTAEPGATADRARD